MYNDVTYSIKSGALSSKCSNSANDSVPLWCRSASLIIWIKDFYVDFPTWIINHVPNKCGMRLHIHHQTFTVPPLKFVNGYVIPSMQGWKLIYVSKSNHWCLSQRTLSAKYLAFKGSIQDSPKRICENYIDHKRTFWFLPSFLLISNLVYTKPLSTLLTKEYTPVKLESRHLFYSRKSVWKYRLSRAMLVRDHVCWNHSTTTAIKHLTWLYIYYRHSIYRVTILHDIAPNKTTSKVKLRSGPRASYGCLSWIIGRKVTARYKQRTV